MIINTVIVFLRDLLPIFILLSYIITLFETKTFRLSFWLYTMVSALALAIIFFTFIEYIASWFEGAGLELFNSLLLLVIYVLFVWLNPLLYKQHKSAFNTALFILIATSIFVSVKGVEFFLFFSVHGHQTEDLYAIAIGCILGTGICISFSSLFTFFLKEISEYKYPVILNILWCLFLAGQFSQITTLLSQVDLINLGSPLFNLSHIIEDKSEYGHILKALIGYEASPSLGFIVIYLITFFIPLVASFSLKKYKNTTLNKKFNHHE